MKKISQIYKDDLQLFCPLCTSNAVIFKGSTKKIDIPPMMIGDDLMKHIEAVEYLKEKVGLDGIIEVTYGCLNCNLEITLKIEAWE